MVSIIQNVMSILESFIIVIFMFLFNEGRRKTFINFIGILLAGGLLTINVTLTTYNKIFSEYTFLIDIIILLLYAGIFLKFRWYLFLISIVFWNVLLIAANMIGLELAHLCFKEDYSTLIGTNNIHTCLTLIFCKILWIALLFISWPLKKVLKKNKLSYIEIISLIGMGTITVIFVAFLLLLIQNQQFSLFDSIFKIGFFVFILDGIIFGLLALLIQQKNKIREANYLNQYVEHQKDLYRELLKNADYLKKQKHNVINALLALNTLIEQKEYDSLNSAVDQTITMLSGTKELPSSNENNMWMALIDYKRQYAREHNIMFNDNIEYGNYTTIRSIDLCVILGNLIDNAIEAEDKERERREVKVIIKNSFGAVYVCVENYISQGRVDTESFMGNSTKEHPEDHGYGLKTVQEIVNDYGGQFKISDKDKYICVEVLLYPYKK